MKQLVISFIGGLLLLCIWGAIVILTSQDFAHEGPHSYWFSPIESWSKVITYTGLPESAASFSPILGILVGVGMLLGPFILALSAVVYLVGWLVRKVIIELKLR